MNRYFDDAQYHLRQTVRHLYRGAAAEAGGVKRVVDRRLNRVEEPKTRRARLQHKIGAFAQRVRGRVAR